MAAVVIVSGGHGHGIVVHHRNQPIAVRVVTFTLTFLLNSCT